MPKKPPKAHAGPVTPRQFRLTESELADIDELARRWGGPVRPLTRTEAIREAVRRAIAEARRKKA